MTDPAPTAATAPSPAPAAGGPAAPAISSTRPRRSGEQDLHSAVLAPGRAIGQRGDRLRRVLVALLPAVGVLGLVLLHPSQGSQDDRFTLVVAWLGVALVVTSIGVAAYLAWRLDGRPGLAWATAGLVLLGLYGAGGAVLALGRVNLSDPLPPTTVVDLVVVATAAAWALAAVSKQFPARDPLIVGLVSAAVASLLRALLPTVLASAPGDGGAALLGLAAVALAVLGGVALLRGQLPAAMRRGLPTAFGLGASVGVVAGGGLAFFPTGTAGWLAVAGLAAAVTVAVMCAGHVREMDRSRHRSVRSLALRLSRAEAARQHNQDRMHELRATAAGVASASEVLAQHPDLPDSRRAALCELLVDETDRLRRLTESFERGKVDRVPLDKVLGRVVGKQRALGQVIRWEPAELTVEADGDMLREVVDILLVNAQMHAPGAWVRVNARLRQGEVVVRVRDTGPGVSPEVADRLFERGVSGGTSEGSGVGLHLARRLIEEMGGSLHHEPTQTGTCFVLTLVPHAEEVDHGAVAT